MHSLRNPPQLLTTEQVDKLCCSKCPLFNLQASAAFIFGCMWEVTKESTSLTHFKLELTGTAQLLAAGKKFKKDEIKFFVVTDNISKIERVKPGDSESMIRARVADEAMLVGSPASFKLEDIIAQKKGSENKMIAPYWWVKEVPEGEESNMQYSQQYFPSWDVTLSLLTNKKAIDAGDVLMVNVKTGASKKARK